MKVLVTGAFGNIGRGTVEALLERGCQVRCFDLKSRENERIARSFADRAEILWGDLREPEHLDEAVRSVDVVIHLAFVIPKLSVTGVCCEDEPDWAWQVNVGGTGNLLAAMKRGGSPKLIFASSLHIYGITRDEAPLRRVTDPPRPIGNYARHKVACERLVRESGLEWAVFRFAAALPFSLKLDGAMFEIPLDNRMEYVHHRDVARALASAVGCPEIWGKVLHIGGGPRCRYTYGEIVHTIMAAVGIGGLPPEAFGSRPFSTDWVDTEESERLLRYQRLTLEDYAAELAGRLGFRRTLVRLLRPLVRALLLRRSAYYSIRRLASRGEAMQGRLAVVTCAADSFGEAVARKLGEERMRVVLVQQPTEDLSVLAAEIRAEGGEVSVLQGSIASPAGARAVFSALRGRFGAPDVLVNHADLVWLGEPSEQDWDRSWERVEQNLLGSIRLGELIVEEMKRNRQGQAVYLEPALKLFPFRPSPLLHGMRSMFRVYWRGIARELRRSPVRVALVKVGISTTELFRIRRLLAAVSGRRFARGRHGVEVRPEVVAQRVWALVIRPQSVAYVPRLMALFSWIESYAGWLVALIRIQLGPKKAEAGS
jgi:UDP-glucose 4-epimerase